MSGLRPQKFIWHGIDTQQNKQQGSCWAPNKRLAHALLMEQGIDVLSLKTDKQRQAKIGRIAKTLLLEWLGKLCRLLEAGIPLYEAIALSDKSQQHEKIHRLSQELLSGIAAGQTFSQALAQNSYAMPATLINMVCIGEQSGKLPESITQLHRLWQAQAQQRKALHKAARYPLLVLLCSSVISMAMLLYLVPQFAEFYAEQQTQLPRLTVWMIECSRLLRDQGIVIGLFTLGALSLLYQSYQHFPRLQKQVARFFLAIPRIGSLYQATLCREWILSLATLLGSGVNLRDGLAHTVAQTRNPLLCEALSRLLTCIESGRSMHQGLQENPLFPAFIVHFVRLGEETGDIMSVLQHLHEHYSEQLTLYLEQINSYIEPALMLINGMIIGTVVLAMYLPIFSMGAAL